MLRTKNFGRKSLNEIKEILGNLSLSFGMRFDSQGRLISPSGTPVSISAGGGEPLPPSPDDAEDDDDDDLENDNADLGD